MQSGPFFFSKNVFALRFDVFNVLDPPVHKGFFGQQRVEDELSVLEVVAVQILRFDFLLGQDILAIENAQLRDVIKHLQAVVLFGLNGVEAEVQFGKLGKLLYVLQLVDFLDLVQSKVEESKRLD